MRQNSDAAGEELVENGRVFADEINGAEWYLEGVTFLGDDGDGCRLRRLGDEQVLEVEKGFQVLLLLHSVVEASVSDPFGCGFHHQGSALLLVLNLNLRVWFWAEDELHCYCICRGEVVLLLKKKKRLSGLWGFN